jgi:hypothetical protein
MQPETEQSRKISNYLKIIVEIRMVTKRRDNRIEAFPIPETVFGSQTQQEDAQGFE